MTPHRSILIFADYYLPGHKAGGPVRTIAAMVERLGSTFSFRIVTRDRDLGDERPYSNRPAGRWINMGRAHCMYLSRRRRSFRALRLLIRTTPHDLLYLNSLFSWDLSIKPLLLRRLRLIPDVPVVLAPRGQLDPSALALKRSKKRIFWHTAKALGLHRDLIWQATNATEAEQIRALAGSSARIFLAPNLVLPPATRRSEMRKRLPRRLEIVYVSRVSPMKNLAFALEVLGRVQADVDFTIYGPLEDRRYWSHCLSLMERLPVCVHARYKGVLPHVAVADVLGDADLLFLPSRAENFGHVILEALLAGCPVLISDRTPWRDLAAHGIGWDLPLNQPARFQQVIELLARSSPDEHAARSKAAAAWSFEAVSDPELTLRTAELLSIQ